MALDFSDVSFSVKVSHSITQSYKTGLSADEIMIHLQNVSSENVIHWKSLFVKKTIQENECD